MSYNYNTILLKISNTHSPQNIKRLKPINKDKIEKKLINESLEL